MKKVLKKKTKCSANAVCYFSGELEMKLRPVRVAMDPINGFPTTCPDPEGKCEWVCSMS